MQGSLWSGMETKQILCLGEFPKIHCFVFLSGASVPKTYVEKAVICEGVGEVTAQKKIPAIVELSYY